MTKNKHSTIGKGKAERAANGGNDEYYTKPELAKKYVAELHDLLQDKWPKLPKKTFIEPSAGNGSFLEPLQKTYPKGHVTGYDLTPRHEDITKADFFETTLPAKAIVVGNPPFGFAASLAVKFFNHAAKHRASVIAFIVPRTFKKSSIQAKLDVRYHLLHQEDTPKNAFVMPTGEYKDVPCVWQVWVRTRKHRVIPKKIKNTWFTLATPASADFAMRRVGGRAGKILDGTNHTVSSTYFIKSISRAPQDIEELKTVLSYLDFSKYIEATAGVRSLSQGEILVELDAYYKNLRAQT